jgi:hypothetical protein
MEASMSTKDVDREIEAYRKQLSAEADLAAGDLDEIEDHLRSLTEDLRESGMPASIAVTEAARRLGDPSTIAREHARVRSGLGAKLSRTRAWSAAVLTAPVLLVTAHFMLKHDVGLMSKIGVELVIRCAVFVALVARVSWARPVLLGAIPFYLVSCVVALLRWPEADGIWIVLHAGVIAFLIPWRRGELTRPGLGISLQVCAYAAATYVLNFQYTSATGVMRMSTAHVAVIAAAVAALGGIMRARWSAVAAAVSAVTLALATIDIAALNFKFANAEAMKIAVILQLTAGVIAAALGAIVSWRTARSTFGSLRRIAS